MSYVPINITNKLKKRIREGKCCALLVELEPDASKLKENDYFSVNNTMYRVVCVKPTMIINHKCLGFKKLTKVPVKDCYTEIYFATLCDFDDDNFMTLGDFVDT